MYGYPLLVASFFLSLTLPVRMNITQRIFLAAVLHVVILAKILVLQGAGYSDTLVYFENYAQHRWGLGSAFMAPAAGLARLFVDDIFGVSVIFSFITVLAIFLAADDFFRIPNRRPIDTVIFYSTVVAGAGFWGAGVTKDGFTLLGAVLIVRGFPPFAEMKMGSICLGVLTIFFPRAHVAIVALAAVSVTLSLAANVSTGRRGLIIIGSAITLAITVPIGLRYVGLSESTDLAEIQEYMDDRASLGGYAGSYVDIQSMSPPVRLFSYLLRPFPFEASGMLQFITSLQNLMILYVLIQLVRVLAGKPSPWRQSWFLAPFMMFLLTAMLLSQVTTNLGLATRQKWMALVPLILAVMRAQGYGRYLKQRADQLRDAAAR